MEVCENWLDLLFNLKRTFMLKNLSLIFVIIFQLVTAQSIDTSFGTAGYSFINPSSALDKAGDFIVDQNQSIIALGNVGPATKRAIYKIDSSGKRDSSFGTNGVNITENSRQYKILKLSDNKFLSVGEIGSSVHIQKFNTNGLLDVGFANAGNLYIDVGPGNSTNWARDAVELNNGQILVSAAYTQGNSSLKTTLLKINQDGSVDTSFGNNGKLIIEIDSGETGNYADNILLTDNNTIVLAGVFGKQIGQNPKKTYLYLAKLQYDGSFVSSFGTNGKKILEFTASQIYAQAVQDKNGNFYIASYLADVNGQRNTSLLKVLKNGQTDTSFGNNGISVYKFLNETDFRGETVNSILVGNQGIYLGGNYYPNPVPGFEAGIAFLCKFNFDGTPDLSFGTNGLFKFTGFNKIRQLSTIKFNSKMNILASGDSNSSDRAFTIASVIIPTETLRTTEITEDNVKIFPNPVIDFLVVESQNKIERIDLYDFSGKIVPLLIEKSELNKNKVKIDFKNIKNGSYILFINNDKSFKIIKK